MAEVIGVSEAQLRFVTNTASGMGLIKCGSVVIPFDNQISKDTDLYKLYITNLHEKIEMQKAKELLDLPNEYHENDLRKALIRKMKDFILELGKDFTFIDEEYKVQVGGDDFRIDLLFFHRGLQCLVAMELKIGKFKPEYISKMDFYLEVLDRQVKKENENPSVGLLLCASRNDEVVEYAMSRTMSPMLVSQYQLQLPDKTILEKKQQFIGLQHCKCGMSWKKDTGFFERTSDMVFALEREADGKKKIVIR